MDQDAKEQVLKALRQWVSHHPRPDEPAIQFGESAHPEGLSPKALLKEVEGNTPDGQFFLAILENAIAANSLETVMKSFVTTQIPRAAAQARAQ
jgi:hypothetical protein